MKTEKLNYEKLGESTVLENTIPIPPTPVMTVNDIYVYKISYSDIQDGSLPVFIQLEMKMAGVPILAPHTNEDTPVFRTSTKFKIMKEDKEDKKIEQELINEAIKDFDILFAEKNPVFNYKKFELSKTGQ